MEHGSSTNFLRDSRGIRRSACAIAPHGRPVETAFARISDIWLPLRANRVRDTT
jgi:hypothetical protein